jgi:hypothetical protein
MDQNTCDPSSMFLRCLLSLALNLVNTMASTPSLNQNAGLRSVALVIGLSLVPRKSSDLRGGIQDLELGWSLIDFARGTFACGSG